MRKLSLLEVATFEKHFSVFLVTLLGKIDLFDWRNEGLTVIVPLLCLSMQ